MLDAVMRSLVLLVALLPFFTAKADRPNIHLSPDLVDDGGGVILDTVHRDLGLVGEKIDLLCVLFPLFRLGDRGEVGAGPAGFFNRAGGLSILQFPVPARVSVGGVEDGILEEIGRHESTQQKQSGSHGRGNLECRTRERRGGFRLLRQRNTDYGFWTASIASCFTVPQAARRRQVRMFLTAGWRRSPTGYPWPRGA
ncbi:MAG: hypothetical protein CL922_05275 [Deltaproteobacteria bacterium]|nr:hypothetical protein [Deltaproteobacteria bacterium]